MCFLFLEHVFLLDPGTDRSVQLQKARYVFMRLTKQGPVFHMVHRVKA